MEKSEHVTHCATNLMQAVSILAHSCGVTEADQLPHQHAPGINAQAPAEPMYAVFPAASTRPECSVASQQIGP
jgi:hypothetical protein